jgi:hypothetical protein
MKKLLILGLVFLSACTKDNLPKFNKLEGLRILAFQTDTPEVNPGTSVTIKPIISDINATSLTYSASHCIDPGLSYGASATCENNPSKQVIASNVALTAPGVGESWTGLADSFTFNVPIEAIMFSSRTPTETYNGVSYLIEYTLVNNLGESVKSVKRIIVSETSKTPKNLNPATSQVFAGGVAMVSLSLSSKLSLSTDLSLTSAENYNLKNLKGELVNQVENLTTTWFVTDGETKFYRSNGVSTNEFTAPDQAPANRSFYLLAISRDDRGGVSLVKKKF